MAVQPGTLNLSLERGIEFAPILLLCKDESVAVTGSLSPNVVGTFTPHGTFGAYDMWILEGNPSTFCYFNTAANSYVIARLLTQAALTDYWVPAAPITEPTGTYVAHGANTGTATATDHTVDLTGYTAEAQVRRQPRGANVILDLAPTVTDPTAGEVTIPAIPSATTSALTSYGKFYWDLVFKSAGNERLGPFVAGSFTISDTITQEGAAPPEL